MTRQPSSPELRRIQGELNLSGLLLREKMRQSGRAKGISKASSPQNQISLCPPIASQVVLLLVFI